MATAGNSRHSENFHKLIKLIVDGCGRVLRRCVMITALSTSGITTLKQFLSKHQQKFDSLFKRHIVNQSQLDILFPPNGDDPNVEEYDVTLLSVILKNTCKISQQQRQAIETIREERNKIVGHISSAIVTDTDFQNYWTSVETAIKTLASTCNDPVFDNDMTNYMKTLETGPLQTESYVKILEEWVKRDKDIDDIAERLLEVERIQNIDPQLENLKDQTKVLIEHNRKKLVETEQTARARKVFYEHNTVVISGKPGEGKTSFGLSLMGDIDSPCVKLSDASQMRFVNSKHVRCIMIDDMFGKYNFDQSKLETWLPHLDTLQAYVYGDQMKLIITSRSHILKQLCTKLQRYDIFKHEVEFSSQKMTNTERHDILLQQLKINNRPFRDLSIMKCSSLFRAPIGYPYCCFLFANDDALFAKGESFFERPYDFFKENVSGLPERKLFILAVIFVLKGELAVVDLEKGSARYSSVSCLVKSFGYSDGILGSVIQEAEELLGMFLVRDKSKYKFSHNVVYETVGLELGKTRPELILQTCTLEFLCQCITLEGSTVKDTLRIETKELYETLAKRMVSEVCMNRNVSKIAAHNALGEKEFVDIIFQQLDNVGKTEDFLRSKESSSETKDAAAIGILVHLINVHHLRVEQGATNSEKCRAHSSETKLKKVALLDEDEDDTPEWTGKYVTARIIQCMKCAHSRNKGKEINCWKCYEIEQATHASCKIGSLEIFNMLRSVGSEIKGELLYSAAVGGHLKLFQTVMFRLLFSVKEIPNFGQLQKEKKRNILDEVEKNVQHLLRALEFVCRIGNHDMFKIIKERYWRFCELKLLKSTIANCSHRENESCGHYSILEDLIEVFESQSKRESGAGASRYRSLEIKDQNDDKRGQQKKQTEPKPNIFRKLFKSGVQGARMGHKEDRDDGDKERWDCEDNAHVSRPEEWWITDSASVQEALCMSCRKSKPAFYALLVARKVPVTAVCIYEAVKSCSCRDLGSECLHARIVNNVIDNMKTEGTWDPDDSAIAKALTLVLQKEKHYLEKLLEEHGISVQTRRLSERREVCMLHGIDHCECARFVRQRTKCSRVSFFRSTR